MYSKYTQNECDICTHSSDKIFYIYFVILFVITILGYTHIVKMNNNKTIVISILWLIINILLLIIFPTLEKIKILKNKKTYLYVTRIFFLIILVLQIIWISEIYSEDTKYVNLCIIVVFILLLPYCILLYKYKKNWSFFCSIFYILLWIFCILYFTI